MSTAQPFIKERKKEKITHGKLKKQNKKKLIVDKRTMGHEKPF